MSIHAPPTARPDLRFRSPSEARAAVAEARGVLVDLDGTLIRTDEVISGAPAFLAGVGDRLMILSNNSSDTEQGLARHLETLGLQVSASRIVLAGVEMVRACALRWPGARTLLVGSADLRGLAEDLGMRLTSHQPDLVLLALKYDFNHADLAAAANAVRYGAHFVVANPDMTHPGRDGALVPETGALAAAVTACSGRRPHLIFGKPEADLFSVALGRLGVPKAHAIMIGDNSDTDGMGAHRFGIASVILDDTLRLADLLP